MNNILVRAPILALLSVTACNATSADRTGSIVKTSSGQEIQRGGASWYGPGFHGRRTASGESFNSNAMTAAHRTLPFGTKLRVVNERNGRSVVVRVNDRGPFIRGRIIDLAKGPAQELGVTSTGTAYVSLHRLD
ncbi:septal ring lytic transglycosylase RlpA family protein [Microvirga sp. 2MCAF38]|uniref:septal ring lytic transglycosylase RlpA family protein n=1 Tax=Microvirga sp. 2MCAF38 TaxID=3232989 RepID=UPI003F97E875